MLPSTRQALPGLVLGRLPNRLSGQRLLRLPDARASERMPSGFRLFRLPRKSGGVRALPATVCMLLNRCCGLLRSMHVAGLGGAADCCGDLARHRYEREDGVVLDERG